MTGKRRFVSGILIFAAALGIGGTAAYLTAFDQKENTVAAGCSTTGIEEEFPNPTPVPIEENPDFLKKVWVTNTSSGEEGFQVDCYVRASLGYSDSVIGKAVVLKNLDKENWVYKNDGYYYYRHVLKEGESTSPLFTGFFIDSTKVEDLLPDQIGEFKIQIYQESVQASGYSDFEEAWDYYANPI